MEKKEYELIQHYPSLPDWIEEGDRVIEKPAPITFYTPKKPHKKNTSLSVLLEADEVENSPDYWKKILPFQVLAFKHIQSENYAYLQSDGCYRCSNEPFDRDYGFNSLTQMLSDYQWLISWVKRKGDNQSFKLGDDIKHFDAASYYKITKIKLKNENISLIGENGENIWLDSAEIITEKLLLTTDFDEKVYDPDQTIYLISLVDKLAMLTKSAKKVSEKDKDNPNILLTIDRYLALNISAQINKESLSLRDVATTIMSLEDGEYEQSEVVTIIKDKFFPHL